MQVEKELLENNCCPMHLKPCVLRKEDNYFFALSKYQKLLEDFLASNPEFVKPSYRLNEVSYFLCPCHAVDWKYGFSLEQMNVIFCVFVHCHWHEMLAEVFLAKQCSSLQVFFFNKFVVSNKNIHHNWISMFCFSLFFFF